MAERITPLERRNCIAINDKPVITNDKETLDKQLIIPARDAMSDDF